MRNRIIIVDETRRREKEEYEKRQKEIEAIINRIVTESGIVPSVYQIRGDEKRDLPTPWVMDTKTGLMHPAYDTLQETRVVVGFNEMCPNEDSRLNGAEYSLYGLLPRVTLADHTCRQDMMGGEHFAATWTRPGEKQPYEVVAWGSEKRDSRSHQVSDIGDLILKVAFDKKLQSEALERIEQVREAHQEFATKMEKYQRR